MEIDEENSNKFHIVVEPKYVKFVQPGKDILYAQTEQARMLCKFRLFTIKNFVICLQNFFIIKQFSPLQ